MTFLLYIIGVILIIEGVPWFLSPEKLKFWISQLIEAPEESLRSMGFGMMIFGLLLVYISKLMGGS
jgi:hypothetical protein